MKRITLVRLGMLPNPAVSNALAPHIKDGKAVAFPIPGAIMTILDTESTLQQVSDAVIATGSHFIISDNTGLHLPTEILAIISRGLEERGMRPLTDVVEIERGEPILSLDQLLDLVAEKGIAGLTPQQRERLDELSAS